MSYCMVKQCVAWKPVKCKNRMGESVRTPIPEAIETHYRGTLLPRILSMPERTPISFDRAINLVSEKLLEALSAHRIGKGPGQFCWYTDNFIEWISSLGYHIELTGDEFESYSISDKVS